MKRIDPIDHPVNATVTLPGSKSYTNRALIIAAMAAGTSQLRQALFSDDTVYMAQALRELGIPVTADETTNTFTVEGRGGSIPARQADLFVGLSGTSSRFLTALAALGRGQYCIDGVARMRERPMQPLLAVHSVNLAARYPVSSPTTTAYPLRFLGTDCMAVLP